MLTYYILNLLDCFYTLIGIDYLEDSWLVSDDIVLSLKLVLTFVRIDIV